MYHSTNLIFANHLNLCSAQSARSVPATYTGHVT